MEKLFSDFSHSATKANANFQMFDEEKKKVQKNYPIFRNRNKKYFVAGGAKIMDVSLT